MHTACILVLSAIEHTIKCMKEKEKEEGAFPMCTVTSTLPDDRPTYNTYIATGNEKNI